MTCEEMLNGINFVGGTLVEYNENGVEFGRGEITKFRCRGNSLWIETPASENVHGFDKLAVPHLRSHDNTLEAWGGKVWIINVGGHWAWQCVIATKGVAI
jgi:hypothetical protein